MSEQNKEVELILKWNDMDSTSEEIIFDVLNTPLKDIPLDLIEENEDLEELDDMQICDSIQIQPNLNGDLITGNQIPTMRKFPGKYNFNFNLKERRDKSAWEYSSTYSQVFININKLIMIQFEYDAPKKSEDEIYFIRAMPVYCSTDFINVPVKRCTLHSIEEDPGNEAHTSEDVCNCNQYNLVGHVLRCHSDGAFYCYNQNNKRHSVALPLDNFLEGKNIKIDVLFSFACKTSCQQGMHRRPIDVLFTLENSRCEVLGKSTLAVKICSCPKRDRDRVERSAINNKTKILQKARQDISDPYSRRLELFDQLRKELKQFNKLQLSIGKTIKNIEHTLTK